MNRTFLGGIILLATCVFVVLRLAGQGFGSFRTDQPFLAGNYQSVGASCSQTNVLTNAMLWFSADVLVTNSEGSFPTNGGGVVWWGSRGTNPVSLAAVGTLNWSNAAGGTLNGQPVITINNSQGRFEENTLNFTQPFTFIIVHRALAQSEITPSTYVGLFGGTNNSCSSEVDLRLSFDGSGIGAYRLYAGSFLDGGTPIYVITNRSEWIVSVQVNGANSWIKTNGVIYATGDVGGNQLQGFQLGLLCDLTGPLTPGIAEAVMLTYAASSNDVFTVEQYLSCKYQIINGVLTGQ